MKEPIVDVFVTEPFLYHKNGTEALTFTVHSIDYDSLYSKNPKLLCVRMKGLDESDFNFNFNYSTFTDNGNGSYTLTSDKFTRGKIRLKYYRLTNSVLKLRQRNICQFNNIV